MHAATLRSHTSKSRGPYGTDKRHRILSTIPQRLRMMLGITSKARLTDRSDNNFQVEDEGRVMRFPYVDGIVLESTASWILSPTNQGSIRSWLLSTAERSKCAYCARR
jgi:hypothetical protein